MGGLIFYVSILRLGKEQIIMKRYGYHRTSTREQHLDRGIKEITHTASRMVWSWKRFSQTSRQARILIVRGIRYSKRMY